MNNKLLAYIAFACTCIFWGTTFLALSFGLESFPPLFVSGSRQAISGILILVFFILSKEKFPSKSELKNILISGFIIVFLSNSLITWSLQYVPTGITGILFTLVPLFVVLINIFIVRNEKINLWLLLGILLGFGGCFLIFNLNNNSQSKIFGIIGIVAGVMSWAVGTIISQKATLSVKPLLVAGLQLFIFGLFTSCISLFTEDLESLKNMKSESIFAVIYLIIFDSIVGYGCYLYALSKLSSSFVSLYAYISPAIALFLGWIFKDEELSVKIIFGVVIIFSGVIFVNRGLIVNKENINSKNLVKKL